MAFKSESYYRNKARRRALEALAEARDIKRRAAMGKAYDWEIPGIRSRVTIARSIWSTYLGYLRTQKMREELRTMAPRDFIAKYGANKS